MSTPSRLGRFVNLPEGINTEQALAAASQNLDAHRDTALGLIDKAIDDLAQGAAADDGASPQAVARLADSIGSLAGMFQLDALSRTAKRLSDIVRVVDGCGPEQSDLIGLHITALRVVRAQPDAPGAAELLRGLDQIAARAAQRGAATAR
jgi:hypothetical protein